MPPSSSNSYCTHCKRYRPHDAFRRDRLGRPYKTCQDCANRRRRPVLADINGNETQSRQQRQHSLTDPPQRRQRGRPRRQPQPLQLPLAFISSLPRYQPLLLGPMNHSCDTCGALHWIDEHISTSSTENPLWEACCKKGDIHLDQFHHPPPYLHYLLTSADREAKTFRDNIRQYNAALTFTSANYNTDTRISNRNGLTCFQIHGELYHLQGPLIPREGQQPCYSQLFFYDAKEAAEIRMERNPQLDQRILQRLTDILHEVNPFIAVYRTARERLQSVDNGDNNVRILLNPRMELIMEKDADRRRYNLPVSNEVAVIIQDEYGQPCKRDILLAKRNGAETSRIDPSHAAYMPLHYVLLFPYGDHGWHWGLRLLDQNNVRTKDRLVQRTYYRYRLHTRRNNEALFRAGRLFQQFVVDAWAICDQDKLEWLRNHQQNFRADLYSGLTDAMLRHDVNANNLGRRIILPSSYTGGDRFMQQLFQDSMAIVRHFGRPTLFITFTANPRWVEIQRELYEGQTAIDRPDIVARVFYIKVKELLQELKQKQIFGRYFGSVWTVEYQKRGLPHVHLLLFLHPDDRFMDAARIDEIISAELPDPTIDPTGELTEIIKSTMTHGPCGMEFPNAPCMRRDNENTVSVCTKRYPRLFQDTTMVKEDGYPLYRRRNNEREWIVTTGGQRTFTMDNRWIVPYNPYLSLRYKAHINVEVCASVQAIKYIHKYIYKGTDRTALQLTDENDEITRHLQARYIGPTEAIWRIFEFPMHGEYPPVIHLPIHLPDQQPIYFAADATEEAIRERMQLAQSKLMAFFQYNTDNEDGQRYLYHEFPTYYTFSEQKKTWSKRKRGTAIGRIYHLSPFAGERYYLRMLLTTVRGPKSFTDIRTVNGIVYSTFQDACITLGLLEDDKEWVDCFTEAVLFSSGKALRMLFTTALLYGNVPDPLSLWTRFRQYICDDLTYRLQQQQIIVNDLEDPHYDYGLFHIDEILADNGKTLADFRLPPFQHNWSSTIDNPLITAELNYDATEEQNFYNEQYLQLNTDQANCFNTIVTSIAESPQASCFFLQGPAGTGKTFLYRCLCHYYRGLGKIVLCIASSGIAALLLPGGRTSHSRFKIPLEVHESVTCAISKSSDLADLLRRTSLIIWDEVPMQHKYCFEAVHRTLADICGNSLHPFGGIPVILGGDFAQILPVVRLGSRQATINACIQQSFLWPQLQQLKLQQNMRVRIGEDNQRFAEWVSSLPYNATLHGRISLLESITQFTSLESFCNHVFPQQQLQQALNIEFLRSRSILSMRNETVAALNDYLIRQLTGDIHIYNSVDSADVNNTTEGHEELPIEFLNSLNPAGLPPARLHLKIGTPIILLRNLYPKEGLCNGTRMMVTRCGQRCIEARMLGGEFDGQLRVIPRIRLTTTETELPFQLMRKQFPVKLCFAMTVNKSQGQSLSTVGVDLRSSAFTHGQLYVALSRVTNVHGLSILLSENGDNMTDNVVYPEVLLE